jgi:hypothetical protein
LSALMRRGATFGRFVGMIPAGVQVFVATSRYCPRISGIAVPQLLKYTTQTPQRSH